LGAFFCFVIPGVCFACKIILLIILRFTNHANVVAKLFTPCLLKIIILLLC
jgi:hypothetical protein